MTQMSDTAIAAAHAAMFHHMSLVEDAFGQLGIASRAVALGLRGSFTTADPPGPRCVSPSTPSRLRPSRTLSR